MRLLLILPLFLLILICSCQRTERFKEINGNLTPVYIDPVSKKELPLPEYFDTISFLPLETNDSAIIGSISKIEFYYDKIFTVDGISNKIYVFDLSGNYLNTIGRSGKGPGEFNKISEASVDTFSHSVVFFDFNLKKELRYDINGSFISEKNNHRWISECHFLDSSTYIYRTGNYSPADLNEKVVYKINLVSNDSLIKSYFPYKEKPEVTTYELARMITRTFNRIYIGKLFNDTIYEFDKIRMVPRFKITYLNSGIPQTILTKNNSEIGEALWKNKTYAYGHQIFSETSSFIFFTYIFKSKPQYCFYSKESGQTQYPYLPASEDSDDHLFKHPVKTNLQNYVVWVIYPPEIINYMNHNPQKIKSAQLQKLYGYIKPTDNPVLMLCKMKK